MHKIEDLIRKYNSGLCSPEEKAWLEQWYQSFELSSKSMKVSDNKIEKLREEVWLALQKRNGPPETRIIVPAFAKRSFSVKTWLYAAALSIVLTGITFFFYRFSKQGSGSNDFSKKHLVNTMILPGTSKAQLVLADGSIISLDSSRTMQLTEKDGTRINKQSGKLVYSEAPSFEKKMLFNILSTPRGGEYQLVLPDGSKVWLNASSSLRFPTRFEGTERTVFLHGEAYFEVVKNATMPFRVELDNEVKIEVLGTRFNIMDYSDESEVRTTLEEGMVKVTNRFESVSLRPAKQAVIRKSDHSLVISNADVDKALAWKNGMIEFDDDDLPYIMRQLSRWYDVDVSFAKDVSMGKYKGAIRRKAPLTDVLAILKIAGVKFKVEDKKITVTEG